jgi:hypothetical protein
VRDYDDSVGVDLRRCSLDSATVKAPKGGPHGSLFSRPDKMIHRFGEALLAVPELDVCE